MFRKMKKCVSIALASAMVLTTVTSSVGATINKIDNDVVTSTDAVPESAFSITVTPEKSEVEVGEEFYVDFVVKNNPGFTSYGFTVNYDPAVVEPQQSTIALMNGAAEVKVDTTDSETGEAKKVTAVSVGGTTGIQAAIAKAANGSFEWGNSLATTYGPGTTANGDGVMMRVYFKALANGSSDIALRNKGPLFFGDAAGAKITDVYVTDATVKVGGDEPIKPIEQTIVKIDNDVVTPVTEMDASAFGITVTPSNAAPAVGEEFYVDFIVKNNPGFTSYGFTVNYDETMVEPQQSTIALMNGAAEVKVDTTDSETGEAKKVTAVSVGGTTGIQAAIAKAANGSFEWGNSLATTYGPGTTANGDGIMMRIYFKAIATGSSAIELRNKGPLFFGDAAGAKIVGVYVADGVVTVGGGSETTTETTTESTTVTETTTESTTEVSTESTTEVSTESTTEGSTESTTEASTEATTVAPVIDATTETTTKRTTSGSHGSSSSGGGGNRTTTTTTEKATEDVTEEETEETTKEAVVTPVTPTNDTVSYVTANGLTLNVPVADMSNAKTFADVQSQTPWAASAISKLSAAGIITGVSETAFNPQANTKRADFMVVISKILGLKGTATSNFADVNASKYYANAVGLTKAIGIAQGVGNNNFAPESTISRQDVMVICDRVLKLVGVDETASMSVLNKFSDSAKIASYARQSVANLVDMDIVSGNADGTINPTADITRAEMAVIMNKVYAIVLGAAEDAAEATTEATTEEVSEESTESDEDAESTTEDEDATEETTDEEETETTTEAE